MLITETTSIWFEDNFLFENILLLATTIESIGHLSPRKCSNFRVQKTIQQRVTRMFQPELEVFYHLCCNYANIQMTLFK